MKKFNIVVDSSCDLSYDYCKEHEIYPIFMKYTIGENIYTDTMKEEDIKEFYNQMRKGAVPKTGQVNTFDYFNYFSSISENKFPILYICLSSGLSGSYNNALQTKEMLLEEFPNREIYIVDSLIASLGTGLQVVEAMKMRDAGKSIEETYEYLLDLSHKVNTYYTTNEMVYLYRGGRVNKLKYMVADAFKINPILRVDNLGKLLVHQSVPGEKKTLKRIVEMIGKNVIDPENQTLFVSHADNLEKAKLYGETIKEKYGFKDIFYSNIGTIIGSHTGPGLVAVFFIGKERTE